MTDFEVMQRPIDRVLYCPKCGLQHIDAADDPHYEGHRVWTNPPHRSHLCGGCGYIWRPADVPTNGVAAIKTRGKSDSPGVDLTPEQQRITLLAVRAHAAAQLQVPAAPGMAAQALAAEIVEALRADEKDGGYDLTAGRFGPAFSALVRRWAALEYVGEALSVQPAESDCALLDEMVRAWAKHETETEQVRMRRIAARSALEARLSSQPAPSEPVQPLSDVDIDRALSTPIPGGSAARDWFLPHESERGLANVRDVVRRMVERLITERMSAGGTK